MIKGYPVSPVVTCPKCNPIIQHKTHKYAEDGRVIVVDGEKEDRQEYINSFAETVGLKNIIKLLLKQGEDPLDGRFAYDDSTAADVSGLPKTINELGDAAKESDSIVREALDSFNKAYGTSYTLDEFLSKSADGTLISEITAKLEAEKNKEEGGAD